MRVRKLFVKMATACMHRQSSFCFSIMYKSLVFIVVCTFSVWCKTITVNCPQGSIVGQKNDQYSTFLGVPYAEVNESQPFSNSTEFTKLKFKYIANDDSILCPQSIYQVSDEIQCLRLNIYVPIKASQNNTVPILVWFHGGGFAFGSAGEYGGQHLVQHDIIVITVNYRLGPYGFLCLNHHTVPGNQGLKDQIIALRWIQRNILYFGGDPTKVTIAGESYGGGAVDLHLYSEYETLFHQAIVQSGSIFDDGFYVVPDSKAAVKIAKHLGYDVTKSREALPLLAKRTPHEVTAAALNLSLPMSVCKEKRFKGVPNFVGNDPYNLHSMERFKNMKIMVGYTSMEMLYVYANQPQKFYDEHGDIFTKALAAKFKLKKLELNILSNIIKEFYLGGKPIGPQSVLELSRASSDFVINNAMERSVNKYLEAGATVYKYLFSYVGGSPYKNITGSGASHTEELKYLFEWETPIVGEEQQLIRNRMTAMWANFVKYGNPTPAKTQLLPVAWMPVTGLDKEYLNIDVNMSMKANLHTQRMAFWDLFFHVYNKYTNFHNQ